MVIGLVVETVTPGMIDKVKAHLSAEFNELFVGFRRHPDEEERARP